MIPAQEHALLEEICHAIDERLERLAAMRCKEAITEEAFISAVLEIEAREVTPHGLTLTASDTGDGWTVFTLKMNGTNEVCAEFEFLPETGEFRHACASCH
jgi:hypothetical protein